MIPQVELFSFVFWRNWGHQGDISKLTGLLVKVLMFLSEGTGVFVISPNRLTFNFPELESLNFSDCYGCPSQLNVALQAYKLSNFKTYSISKHFSVTKIQKVQKNKKCSSVWRYDKNIGIFWQKSTFKQHGGFYLQKILFNMSSFVKYCQEFINIPCP